MKTHNWPNNSRFHFFFSVNFPRTSHSWPCICRHLHAGPRFLHQPTHVCTHTHAHLVFMQTVYFPEAALHVLVVCQQVHLATRACLAAKRVKLENNNKNMSIKLVWNDDKPKYTKPTTSTPSWGGWSRLEKQPFPLPSTRCRNLQRPEHFPIGPQPTGESDNECRIWLSIAQWATSFDQPTISP